MVFAFLQGMAPTGLHGVGLLRDANLFADGEEQLHAIRAHTDSLQKGCFLCFFLKSLCLCVLLTNTKGVGIWAKKKKDDMNHSRRPPENFNGCWC